MRPERPARFPGGDKYRWTNHVQRKLQFYALTPSRVLRVLRAPDRMEEGVAEGTLAAMQTAGTKAKPWEIWVMWREEGVATAMRSSKKVIITAWRYPGVSPIREKVPMPSGLMAELESEGII